MLTFISLIRFTDQGARDVTKSVSRSEAFRVQAERHGVVVKDIYWTLGSIDGVLVFEAADAEVATAAMLELAALDNVKTETIVAFDSTSMQDIIDRMGTS